MSKSFLLVVAMVVVACSAYTYPESAANGWDNDVAPFNSLCIDNRANGRQTPIDIITEGPMKNVVPAEERETLHYWQPSLGTTSDQKLKYNGHAVELELGERAIQFTSSVVPQTYKAAQLHFHTPSEHWINGHKFDAELHIVHFSPANARIVVIGILFEEGEKSDPLLEQLMPFLPHLHVDNPTDTSEVLVDIIPKLHLPNEFYIYEGSLTTPPCSEIVTWFVSTRVRSATKEQIEALEHLMMHTPGVGNARSPVGIGLNGRQVTLTKFSVGNTATTGPFQPPNSIAPTYVESIIPAGNRVLLEVSQAQGQDIFGIHGSQLSNLWANPVGYEDDSGIDAETGIVIAIGPNAMDGGHWWREGATVIFNTDGCETVGLNGFLYHLCDASQIYGELSSSSWGSNSAHQFTSHLNTHLWQSENAFWRHRTF